MTNELIAQARKRYLAQHPLRTKELETVNADGSPSDVKWTFPDLGDTQVIAMKLGVEYLAICHDDDAVEEWISTCMGIGKDPEWMGILFANVFRGVNTVIGESISNAGLRSKMQQLALEAWQKDFGKEFAGETS